MSDYDSDSSELEFDFDTDISEFSGFSASDEDSDREVEGVALDGSLDWKEELTSPMIEPFHEIPGPVFDEDFGPESSPLEFFWRMFPLELLVMIVEWTNGYQRWVVGQPGARADPTWFDVTIQEMRAFLAINIFMGIYRLPTLTMYWSRSPLIGTTGVAAIMTCNRFRKLLQYFHVAEKVSEPKRDSPNYRLCKVQPVIDILSDTFQSACILSQEVSVGEAMIPFKGRLSYRQYMPAKPVKTGIKVWALCDARNGYLSKFNIYFGKQKNTSESELGYNVVIRLTEFIQGSCRMVFFDDFFTDVDLMKDLLSKGLYACGKVHPCRKGFPLALKKPPTVRERGQYHQLQMGRSNLVASVWKDKRLVHHLSTLSDPNQIVDARRRSGAQVLSVHQPQSVFLYNRYIGGVEQHDQLRAKYDVGRHGKKAWRYIFWYLLNCAIVNAFILFNSASTRTNKKKRFSHLDFRMELIQQLLGGYAKRKRDPAYELNTDGVFVCQENAQGHVSTRLPGNGRTCKYHARKLNKRRETVYGCGICNVHLCREGCHQRYHASE